VFTIDDRVAHRLGQVADFAGDTKDAAIEKAVAAKQAIGRGAETTRDAVVGGVKATGRAIETGVETGVDLAAYGITKIKEKGAAAYEMGKRGVDNTIDAFERGKDRVTNTFLETVDKVQNGYRDTRAKFLNSVVDGPKYYIAQRMQDMRVARAQKLQERIAGGTERMHSITDKIHARCDERGLPYPELQNLRDLRIENLEDKLQLAD